VPSHQWESTFAAGARTCRKKKPKVMTGKASSGSVGTMEPGSGPPLTEQDPAKPGLNWTGRRFGDFQVLRLLGQGGMGQVYLAEQISLKRKVALKLLRPELAANQTAFARFKAEAHAVAQATHANIVQVYALGEEDGTHFMALEYVEGRNLRQFLEKKGPPELLLALSIIRQVAAALQRASEMGIVHRDIKPENILLSKKGEVKVADFGLSRFFGEERQPLHLTQSGMTMGTPLYMSPEQVEGKTVDPRTDIYSLGVTIYHLLAGEPPFRGNTAFEVAIQHVQSQPRPLAEIRSDLPPALCSLVHRMMAKKPDDRVQSCREVVREVVKLRETLVGAATLRVPAQAADGSTATEPDGLIQAGPVTTDATYDAALTQSLPIAPQRRWTPWLVAVTIVLGLGAGLGLGYWHSHTASPTTTAPEPLAATSKQRPEPDAALKAAIPEQEKRLLDHLQTAAGDDIQKCRLDLAVYYLKVDRLEDADKYFKLLEDSPKNKGGFRQYSILGKAIVLALRDETKASNDLFLIVFKTLKIPAKEAGVLPPPLQRRQDMAEWTAKALQRNFVNSPATFPPGLQAYRALPPARLKSSDKTVE
jgi:eukaryotic-like serine/threonine-protein kinase